MLRPAQTIALCVLALLTLGVVMVNSADMTVRIVGSDQPQDPGISPKAIFFSRSTLYMGLAILAMAAGAIAPVRAVAASLKGESASDAAPLRGLRLFGLGCVFLILVCALVYVPGLKREINNSHRWIGVGGSARASSGEPQGGLTMQPSEVAKWGLVALMAWYGASRAAVIHRFWTGLVPALFAIGAVAGFVVLEDLGTGVLIASSACVVLLAAGARLRQFAMFVPFGLVGFAGAVITNPYRVHRITAFLNPYEDPEKKGYHMIQSLIAVANGEGFGRGLGHGLQKLGYLPEDRTDFIFAVICEELGIAGAAVVISLFLALVWSCYLVVKRERDPLLRLFGLGIMCTVGLQACMNLAVVTGLAPTKGIALPLLSSGGTGWILTAFSLGLVIAIDRTRRALEAPAASIIEARPLAAPRSAAPEPLAAAGA